MRFTLALLAASICVTRAAFPAGFGWGASTAAYQVEGAWNVDGRGPSIWDTFSHTPGNVFNNDTGDDADNFYYMYKEDIALMKKIGLEKFRFSVSWSRVIPTGSIEDGINEKGLQFYSDLVDALLEAGIEPNLCLYHWDLPQGLYDKYKGWIDRKIVDDYVNYADLIFKTFAGRVKNYFTFNEPWVFSVLGYGIGVHAPGTSTWKGTGDSWKDPYAAVHHILLAHAHTAKLYRQKYLKAAPDTLFSIVVNTDYFFPLTNSIEDKAAADRTQLFQVGLFLDPIIFGQYPDVVLKNAGENVTAFTEEESVLLRQSIFHGSDKIVGINHYTSQFAYNRPADYNGSYSWGGAENAKSLTTIYNGTKIIGAKTDSPWLQVVPTGFRGLMNWLNDRYKSEGIAYVITENGVDCPDESNFNWPSDALQDHCRINYLSNYLQNLELAINEDGVDVRGYFTWSLLDNYEWADGYSKRFGLVYVDYTNGEFTRTPKNSFYWFEKLVKHNAVPGTEPVHVIQQE